MLATNDTKELLQSILNDPFDYDLRLIYADALEEAGDCDRAEFVRVQCDFAAVERELLDSVTVLALISKRDKLNRRAMKLLSKYGCRWSEPCRSLFDTQCLGEYKLSWRFELGFVSTLRCGVADWYGRVTSNISQMSAAAIECGARSELLPGFGPQVVAHQPITVVTFNLADRAPATYDDWPAVWYRDMSDLTGIGTWEEIRHHNALPGPIFDLLPGGEPGGLYFMVNKLADRRYTSLKLAWAAASTAMLNWARAQVKLPPLSWERIEQEVTAKE